MSLTNSENRLLKEFNVDGCPICGSTNVRWANEDLDLDYCDFGNGLAWRQGVCCDCGSVWEEQYDIARIYVISDGCATAILTEA